MVAVVCVVDGNNPGIASALEGSTEPTFVTKKSTVESNDASIDLVMGEGCIPVIVDE